LSSSEKPQFIVIKGSVFDGSEYYQKGAVVVDSSSGKIAEAGKESEIDLPAEHKTEDEISSTSSDLTILPGLIDCHVHFFGTGTYGLTDWVTTPETMTALRAVADMRRLLYVGFTAVRDLGSKAATYLKTAELEGAIVGPRVIPAGRSLAQTGGNDDPLMLPLDISQRLSYSYYCDGPWECRKAVRLCLRDGAECIKVYASGSFAQGAKVRAQLSVEELQAIVDEAHRAGLKVAAHAYGEEAMANVVEAGVDSIEHGIGLTEEIVAGAIKKGIFYVPTLTPFLANKSSPLKPSPQREAYVQRHLTGDLEIAKSRGLKIANGSDFVGSQTEFHGHNYIEIVNVAKYFGNNAALVAATANAADCLGLEKNGRVKKDYAADLVVVRGNPLEKIESLAPSNIVAVIRKGRLFRPQNAS
jgi:imidazolonepropionase-like amidohydrolase